MTSPLPHHIIDLTHTLEETIPSWNGSCGFHQVTKLDYAEEKKEVSFRVQQLKMHAGIGTHLDAPTHCNLGTLSIEQLSLDNLIAPCVMIDLSAAAHERYTASAKEIQVFEKNYGIIEPGSFVILRTGWERFWKEPARYHNNYLFPAVSAEAATLLLERGVVGLGIDTLSPDRPGEGFPTHATFLGANKYIVENIANAALLPPKGSMTFALPIKTHGGTEAPMRLIALVKK